MFIGRLSNPENFPSCEKYTYLDAASIALMYQGAIDATQAWQQDVAENGTANFSETAERDIFEDLRAAGAELFGANVTDIAAGSSTTELLSSLAWSMLPSKDQVIVGTDVSFPTTLYPWARVARQVGCKVRVAKADEKGRIDAEELLSLIDDQTAIVALSHVEFKTGQTYDLGVICAKAHHHGARVVVDATQSAGQVPINVGDSKVDALVSGGYKWNCGPFGAAIMYVAPHLLSTLDPGIVGWRSHEDIWSLDATRLNYHESARRFEAGTVAYGCAIGLGKSIEHLNAIGIDNILNHNMALNSILEKELTDRGAVSLISESERSSILSMHFPGRNSELIARELNEAKVYVSFRNTIRVSPHLYNDENDIHRTIEIIDAVLKK
jgi:cysteine desulfurase / selenocysteine lyase